jgi:hypothetical protein
VILHLRDGTYKFKKNFIGLISFKYAIKYVKFNLSIVFYTQSQKKATIFYYIVVFLPLSAEFTSSKWNLVLQLSKDKIEILKSDLLYGLSEEEIKNKIENTDLQIYDFLKGMN